MTSFPVHTVEDIITTFGLKEGKITPIDGDPTLQTLLRPVLSRYLEANLGADLESDLRTKTDQIGSKSVCFVVLDRTIPPFLPIGEAISKIGILAIG
jgi:hypothetical protein